MNTDEAGRTISLEYSHAVPKGSADRREQK